MTDFITAVNLYGNPPQTLADIQDRLDDLESYTLDPEKVKRELIEETSAVSRVTADGMTPVAAVNNWWQAFISDINTYAGVGSRSLVSRRLIRVKWVQSPSLKRKGQEFEVLGAYQFIKLRMAADEPVAAE